MPTPDLAWVAELAKSENDAFRAAGDVQGLFDKYRAPVGIAGWRDAPLNEFLGIVGDEWLGTLSNAQRNQLFGAHVAAGLVSLSNLGTRQVLAGFLTPAQQDAFEAEFAEHERLFESLGLTNVGRRGISVALSVIDGTPQQDQQTRSDAVSSILGKIAGGAFTRTSTVNLTSIDSLLGI